MKVIVKLHAKVGGTRNDRELVLCNDEPGELLDIKVGDDEYTVNKFELQAAVEAVRFR